MCKHCFQVPCVCDHLYDEILSLQGYDNGSFDVATCLNLTIETFLFSIGTKHVLNSKGKYENGVLVNIGHIADTYVRDKMSILGDKPIMPTRDKDLQPNQKKKKKKSTMYNQVEFKAFVLEKDKNDNFNIKTKNGISEFYESKLSIMIFTNGSVKVTGIRNPKTITKVCVTILNLLKQDGYLTYLDQDDASVPETPLKIWDIRPAMINTTFRELSVADVVKPKIIISKKNLQEVMNTSFVGSDKPISMITNKKSLMNIKFKGTDTESVTHVTRKGRKKTKNEVTILVFYTGKFSIIGTTVPENIKKAYFFMCNLIRDYPVIFEVPKRRPRVRN